MMYGTKGYAPFENSLNSINCLQREHILHNQKLSVFKRLKRQIPFI